MPAGDIREFHPVVDAFCTEYQHQKEPGTVQGYRHTSQHFLDFLGDHWDREPDTIAVDELDAVDTDTVKLYVNRLLRDYPDSTTKTRYYYLRSFLAYLEDVEDVLAENPAEDVNIGDYVDREITRQGDELRAKSGVIYLEDDEIDALLRNVPEPRGRNELMLKLMLQCGLRASEVVALRCGDIDRDERRLAVKTAKTGRIRDVWYQPSLDPLLSRWLDADRASMPTSGDSDRVFISRYSAEMSPNRPNRVVTTAAENADIQEVIFEDGGGNQRRRITAHTLRHTFAVQCVRNGMDVRSLQMLMGHEKISTTEKYLRFSGETLRDKMMQHAPD